MTERKIFGVAVRIAGLYVGIYMGILDLYSGIGCWANPSATHGQSIPYLVMGTLAAVTGILLIKGEWLVRFAYGPESQT